MLVGGGAGLGQLGVYVGECFSGCHNLCGAYLCGCRNNLGIGPLVSLQMSPSSEACLESASVQ